MTSKKAPEPPKAQSGNSFYYDVDEDGNKFLRSQAIYNKKTKQYETSSYLTPKEIESKRQSQQLYNDTLGTLVNGAKDREGKYNNLADEYQQLGEVEVGKAYNKAKNDTINSYNERGLLKSSGYEDLANNQLVSAKASDLRKNAFDSKNLAISGLRDEENQLLSKLQVASGNSGQFNSQALQYGDFGRQLYNSNMQSQLGLYQQKLAQVEQNNAARKSNLNMIGRGLAAAGGIVAAPFTGGLSLGTTASALKG